MARKKNTVSLESAKGVKVFKRRIQGMSAEGRREQLELVSLLTGNILNGREGLTNNYLNYQAQVIETYKKYNGRAEYGSWLLRAIADIRTAFIAGESINIQSEDQPFNKWVKSFLEKNRMFGNRFYKMILTGELTGRVILDLSAERRDTRLYSDPLCVKISRITDKDQSITFKNTDNDDFLDIKDIYKGKGDKKEAIKAKNPMLLVLGGDDTDSKDTTTKIGLVLNDIENYDRALKDMRRLNQILARITPTFKTSSKNETMQLLEWLNASSWDMGDAFIGTASFKYEVPSTGAHQNIVSELVANVKAISATTSVPVHWLGYVDLMSNRATAETLYEMVNNGTIVERTSWVDFLKALIIKAQEIYIDKGGKMIKKVNTDFTLTIPLISFGKMLERIQALSTAYADRAISMADYRGGLPGLNPLETKAAIAKEEKEAAKAMRSSLPVEKTLRNDDNDDNVEETEEEK